MKFGSSKNLNRFKTSLGLSLFCGQIFLPLQLEAQELSLDEKLKSVSPKLPAAAAKTSLTGTLGLLLRPEDLRELVDIKKISSCRTSSLGNGPDAKNYSNFGQACFKESADRFYLNSDLNLRKNGDSLLRPNYGWNTSRIGDIVKPVPERALFRSAQILVSENEALSRLLLGKVQIEFSPETLFRDLSVAQSKESRPVYVVVETQTVASIQEGQLVASVGNTLLPKRKMKSEKKLLEEVPGPTQASADFVGSESAFFGPKPRDLRDQVASYLGVEKRPFSRFALQINRSSGASANDVGLKFSELNGIMYIEKAKILGSSQWDWGWKLPMGRHFVGVHYPSFGSPSVRTYGYVVDESRQITVAYNAFDASYLLSLKSNL